MARGTNQSPKHKGMSYTKFGYIFIAPFVLVYCIFSLYPLITTFIYSGANMTSTTANFWGFDDKDIYYDRYLDLTKYFSSSFEEDVGIPKNDYQVIRNFFSLQDLTDLNGPYTEAGFRAIINNGANEFISQSTLDQLQACINSKSLQPLTDAAISELKAWKTNYSEVNSETTNMTSFMSSINSTVDAILNPVEAEGEGDATVEEVTPDTIAESDAYADLIATLNGDLNEGQQMLVAYLDSYVAENSDSSSVIEYLENAQQSTGLMSEPAFFYMIEHLNAPNAILLETDENGKNIKIDAITVPFYADLKTYLTTNVWVDMINQLGCASTLASYASGSAEIPAGTSSGIYSAITTLGEAGVINKIKLIEADGTLVPVEEKANNVLYALENYAPTPVTENERAAAMQIGNTVFYWESQYRLLLLNYNIDQYITFTGDFNRDRYIDFKSQIPAPGGNLAQYLTYDKYKELDSLKKDQYIEKCKADKADAQSQLATAEAAVADAKAAYNAAKGTDGEDAAKKALKAAENNLAGLKTKITMAERGIAFPTGILSKVNASKQYIMVGFENFNDIFNNVERRNTVLGAFITTFQMWLIGFAPQIILALILSAWFTDTKLNLKGLNLMKALMYLPNVITAVTVAIFFRKIFSFSSNLNALPPAQIIVRAFTGHLYNFFEKPWPTKLIVCFINFWMWYGNTMIVLIAGITSISESLYESAQIDGANSFQTYTKITMPLLRPILLYTMVTSMIGGLQMYDIPQNVNMSPARINFHGTYIRSTRTVLMYVNDLAFGKSSVKQVGIAASTSIILFVVTTILSVAIFYIMRDKDAAKAAKAKKLARKAGATK